MSDAAKQYKISGGTYGGLDMMEERLAWDAYVIAFIRTGVSPTYSAMNATEVLSARRKVFGK